MRVVCDGSIFFTAKCFSQGATAVRCHCGSPRGNVPSMGFFSRMFGGGSKSPGATATQAPPTSGDHKRAVYSHFQEFVKSRVGVEAYLEPANNNEPTSLLLIATTGEWTRRRIPAPREGYAIAKELGIPIYDVNFTGYPQRMRDWNTAQRNARKNGSA